ncbi:unnamed protein product [Nesidiocoris tenuis]|uniref:Gamma-interferon-inducible lysosomal thiol reductase n=1 Tax=Nesidiocoris tenuis TaxID=355587 RepID=A0A6H5H1A8_9HEMI|nr:unnamed protein product [Nesidiocoris tenuis]
MFVSVPESTKRLHIDVFYESLCSDSRDFFINQLRPTILELAAYIDVDLIPYGKAKTTILPDTRITSTCQHGHEECYGNRIHACALALSTCSKRLGFNWKDIRNCANSHLGFALQYNHGIQTQALKPSVTFIPTIVVDQVGFHICLNKSRRMAGINYFKLGSNPGIEHEYNIFIL